MKIIKAIFLLMALMCATGAIAQNGSYPYDKVIYPYYDPDNYLGDFKVIMTRDSEFQTFYDEKRDATYTYQIEQNGSTCNNFYYATTSRTEPNQVLYVPGWVTHVKSTPWDEPQEEDTHVEVTTILISNIWKSSNNFTKLILPYTVSLLDCNFWGECEFLKEMIVGAECMLVGHSFLHDDVLESYLTQVHTLTYTPTVKFIDGRLLCDAKSLKTLIFNAKSVEWYEYGEKCFDSCDVVEKLYIGPEVLDIPKGMFNQMGGIKVVQWDAENFHGWTSDPTNLFKSRFDLLMGTQVENIGPYTFYGSNIKSVCVKDIQSWMKIKFANYYSNPITASGTFKLLKAGGDQTNPEDYYSVLADGLDLTDCGVDAIGNYQFAGCNNIEKIIIPSTIKHYGNNFLSSCDNLKEIRICGTPCTDNLNCFDGLPRENVTIMLDNKEVWDTYHDIGLFKGFKVMYVGMPEEELGHKVVIPYTGITFAKFDENVTLPEGLQAYYADGGLTAVTLGDEDLYKLAKTPIEDVPLPANTVLIILGPTGEYYFTASDQGTATVSSALTFGGTGANNVYKYDEMSPLPRFVKTTKGEKIDEKCAVFTVKSGQIPSGVTVDEVYIECLNHEHSFDQYGFCTYVDEESGVHCQAVEEPAQGAEGLDRVYLISNPGNMQWIANQCLAGESKDCALMNDIDFTKVSKQVTIGNLDHPYTGKFNGKGNTVYLNLTGSATNYAGVFGTIGQGGYVHHMNVAGIMNRPNSYSAGAVAGVTIGATVSCCNSSAEIKGMSNAAGIVGAAYESTIENCSFTGKFTLGQLPYGIVVTALSSTIKSCYVASDGIDDVVGIQTEFQNCYALNEKTAEAFANGEICWKLNGNSSDGVWKQNLKTPYDPKSSSNPDALPTLDPMHAAVYTCTNCLGKQIYANTEGLGVLQHIFTDKDLDGEILCDNMCGSSLVTVMPDHLNAMCRLHNGVFKPVDEKESLQVYIYTGIDDKNIYGVTAESATGMEKGGVVAGFPYLIDATGDKIIFEPGDTDYDYHHQIPIGYNYSSQYEALCNAGGMQGVLNSSGATLQGDDYLVFTGDGALLAPTEDSYYVKKGESFVNAKTLVRPEVIEASTEIDTYGSKPITGIDNIVVPDTERTGTFNLMGQPVGDDYKGFVIKDGKKVIQK